MTVDRVRRGVEITPEHPLDRVVGVAEEAAAAGFDAAMVSCHYFNRDPFVAADRIGRATDLHVGPAAANPYDTHPVALAARTATLQETTDGRAAMGLAPGDRSTMSALGVEHDRPLRRILETMRVARRLWDGERVSHDGTFQAEDAGLEFAVESPPVYVCAQGPDMLRMSGKHADGVLINASHPCDVAWSADRIDEGRADRPDRYGSFDSVAYASVSVAADRREARAAARPPVAFIAGGAAPPVLDRHNIDHDPAATVSDHLESGDLRAAFDTVTPRMIDAFCAAGTPAEVEERFDALLDHVDGVVVGAPLGPDPETAVSLAGRAVRAVAERS
jgi:5,10-methylenetetrahydromethanopterin reductase